MRILLALALGALFLGHGSMSAAAEGPRQRMERTILVMADEAGMAAPEGAAAAAEAPIPVAKAVNPYVVIFKGPTICAGCETPFEAYFRKRGYEIRLVKPGESTPEMLSGAAVYIVPGGDDVVKLEDAWTAGDRDAIRDYVRKGGRYYGSCLGGYWAGRAGSWPGTVPGFEALDMIPAEVLELSVNDKRDKVVGIHWNGRPRKAYFQDGPSFVINDPSRVVKIYATYDDNRLVAAFTAQYGLGKVAVIGVHPEATQDWYDEFDLPAPKNLNRDLLDEILGDLLSSPAA